MGKKRPASPIQALASQITKLNKGKSKVKLADVREVLKDVAILQAAYHVRGEQLGSYESSPLGLLNRQADIQKKELTEIVLANLK